MSGYPGSHQITVTVDFGVDPPRVRNSTNQQDRIEAGANGITWASQPDKEGLTIKRIEFFSDAAKQNQVTPSYLSMPGSNWGRMNWYIPFSGTQVTSEQTLYYKLYYSDRKYDELQWDPVLRIDPRGG